MVDKREYGLMIRSENKHGTEYVSVKVMVREGDNEYPRNPDSDGEQSSYGGAPAHMDGYYLDGLGWSGFVSVWRGDPSNYIGYQVDYTDVYSIDARKVEKMAKTFRRVSRQFAKDQPTEPGDVFLSLAAALRLSFAVWQVDPSPGRSFYSDNKWRWATIPEGRDHLRRSIAAAIARADGKVAAA